MKMPLRVCVCALIAAGFVRTVTGMEAEVSQQDFAAALVPSVQTPDAGKSVSLMRFSFFCGRHANVYGLDLGVFGNIIDEDLVGCAISGVFSQIGRSRSAFQFSGLYNGTDGAYVGLQMTLGVNVTRGGMTGLQAGLANIAPDLRGMQLGVFNKTRMGVGFQLGGINVSERFTGVQIGILNLNLDSPVPMSPIFNCYF